MFVRWINYEGKTRPRSHFRTKTAAELFSAKLSIIVKNDKLVIRFLQYMTGFRREAHANVHVNCMESRCNIKMVFNLDVSIILCMATVI